MIIAISCLAVLGLLVFGLGFAISLHRVKQKAFYAGSVSDPTSCLTKLVRAHANTTEYAGMLAVFILFLGTLNPPQWVLGAMIVATLGRVLVVIGFLTSKDLTKMNLVKGTGAMLTYFAGLAMVAALISILVRSIP